MPLKQASITLARPSLTKFGGLPVWVDEPAWPICHMTQERMPFIGQVEVDPRLFPVEPGRVVYLFQAESESEGECSVVVQQADPLRQSVVVDGPQHLEYVWDGGSKPSRHPFELTVSLRIMDGEPSKRELFRSRMGGRNADWIQADETPEGWIFFLQFGDSLTVDGEPMDPGWNFGTGYCYVFLSPDFRRGKMFWQC